MIAGGSQNEIYNPPRRAPRARSDPPPSAPASRDEGIWRGGASWALDDTEVPLRRIGACRDTDVPAAPFYLMGSSTAGRDGSTRCRRPPALA
jgi:hypothetical protein